MNREQYVELTRQTEHLRPSNVLALFWIGLATATTGAGVYLTLQATWLAWLSGSVLIGIACMHWFVILHEAGHDTLFPSLKMNLIAGNLASLFCAIPYHTWRSIHWQHHIKTGYRDLDPTTQSTVPRKLSGLERVLISVSWKTGFPLFSVVYRTGNYWNLPRLFKLFPERKVRFIVNVLALLAIYALIIQSMGFLAWLKVFGFGFFISLVIADPVLLSQHTHIPWKLAEGQKVRHYKFHEQDELTRSLMCPWIVSRFVFLNFDYHELHHLLPFVPAYHFGKIDYKGPNTVRLMDWITRSKKMDTEKFIFSTTRETGIKL